jgi:hypothetical protein
MTITTVGVMLKVLEASGDGVAVIVLVKVGVSELGATGEAVVLKDGVAVMVRVKVGVSELGATGEAVVLRDGVVVMVRVKVGVSELRETGVSVALAVMLSLAPGEFVEVGEDVALGVEVAVLVSLGLGVNDWVKLPVGVSVAVEAAHGTLLEVVTEPESRVTAPFRASSLPWMVAPVTKVMDEEAKMLPANAVPAPSVAELPTAQNTLLAWALLMRTTELPTAVINVEAVLNMKMALLSPPPSRVSMPVRPKVPAAES